MFQMNDDVDEHDDDVTIVWWRWCGPRRVVAAHKWYPNQTLRWAGSQNVPSAEQDDRSIKLMWKAGENVHKADEDECCFMSKKVHVV